MKSLILRTATGYLIPLLILYAVFLFVGGHSAPGGGFVGGLVVAAAISLAVLAYEPKAHMALLPLAPQQTMGAGLLTAAIAALWGPLLGEPFLTGLWADVDILGVELTVGTPLLFDLGVFLAVIGAVLTIVATLTQDEEL